MNNDLISRSELTKAFEETVCIEPMHYAFVKQIIDNAPTVEPKKEIVPVCKVTFDKEQLQEIVDKKVAELVADCENCPFKKFSEDVADKLAKVMIDNGITDFDEFAKRCGVSYLHQDSITKSDTQL